MVKPRQLQNTDDPVANHDDDQVVISDASLQIFLLALLATSVITDLNAAANDDTSVNNASEAAKSVAPPNPLLNEEEKLNQLKEIYGNDVFEYLAKHNDNSKGIHYRNAIELSTSYVYRQNGCVDYLAQSAAKLICYRSYSSGQLHYPDFLSLLAEQLRQCATSQDKKVSQSNKSSNPNFYEILQRQAYEVFLEYEKLIKPPSSLTLDEKTKIGESMVYAIATLKDPLNPALIDKLAQNASQTLGITSNKTKKFYGTLCLVALTVIAIYTVVAIPWTGGLSVPLGLALGGSLLSGGGAAGFFYSAKPKSMSKNMYQLGETLEEYQKHQRDHNTTSKKNR